MMSSSTPYSGAPAAEGRKAEPQTYRKVKETYELIFLMVIMASGVARGAYDDDGNGEVAQHGSNNGTPKEKRSLIFRGLSGAQRGYTVCH